MAFAHGWALATMPLISVDGDDIIETPNSLLNVTRATKRFIHTKLGINSNVANIQQATLFSLHVISLTAETWFNFLVSQEQTGV